MTVPIDTDTTAAPGKLAAPSALRPLHALARRLIARVDVGRIVLTLPDGTRLEAVGAEPGPHAALQLRRWRPLWRLLIEGDLGLARAYRDGDWTSADPAALLAFGIANEVAWGELIDGRGPARWLAWLVHRLNANTRRGSRQNISFHYDLGNAFYRQWLDDSMLYSSALYAGPDDSLEAAQARRLELIVDWLGVPHGGSVLEIGCGWGTLAATLAQRRGARVTGVTLSTEQLAFARERARAWGVAERVDLRLQDYRDVDGRYDRIVSIEMIEAVGESYWPTYFATLRERLAPGGAIVLQAITIADAHFDAYRARPDFIQRFIFPGGMLPSPRILRQQAARAGLEIVDERCFGAGYAATLAEWRRRFLTAWPAIAALGFDLRFRRLWEYYLCYCEAGFRAGRVDVGLYRLRHRAG